MFTLLFAYSVHAATLAGVTLPDASAVGGQRVSLNGIGLREKMFIDVYVGGLYLTHPTKDGAAAIAADEPKSIVMHFIYSKVSKEQMIETFTEGFGHQTAASAHKASIDQLYSWIPAQVVAGNELSFEYGPGRGTTILLNGRSLGNIPGADFMKLLFGVYLGAHPPTDALKKGMLTGTGS